MDRLKYVLVDSQRIPPQYLDIQKKTLEKAGVDCFFAKCRTPDEALQYVCADALGTVDIGMDREFIARLHKCKAIVCIGMGCGMIDTETAAEKGITVCDIPIACVEEVATHTMALMLDIVRKITLHDRHYRTGAWDASYGYDSLRLSGLTLGLIGFGNTARLVSKYAKAFGMHIMGYDPFSSDAVFSEYGVKRAALDEIYASADIISVHLPLTKDTHRLVDKNAFAKMKDGVFVVNTARGAILNLDDFLEALDSGKVTAAGFDVVEGEPIGDLSHPVFSKKNLVLTPHCAFTSRELFITRHKDAADAVLKVFGGEKPDTAVNR